MGGRRGGEGGQSMHCFSTQLRTDEFSAVYERLLKNTLRLSGLMRRQVAPNLERGGKEKKHWALRPQKPLRLIMDGEVWGSEILYLTPTRYTVTTRMILH